MPRMKLVSIIGPFNNYFFLSLIALIASTSPAQAAVIGSKVGFESGIRFCTIIAFNGSTFMALFLSLPTPIAFGALGMITVFRGVLEPKADPALFNTNEFG
ncbi:hypothetical protein AVEN_213813-1 [Araneus ventricosus]|uniref:Uncharacterized protein n=1 Tax=Araneus ventricosus TaxID=182803 RepID=A0A4Y2Q5L2_ARAVE|nr:hypothetical protein AVEN_213813-1 [Araneus ventricosus]